MKELIEYIVKALVDRPEAVEISQTEGESVTILEIRVGDEDIGKVIGKEGRIANSIRAIAKAAAAKNKRRVTVEIIANKEEPAKKE